MGELNFDFPNRLSLERIPSMSPADSFEYAKQLDDIQIDDVDSLEAQSMTEVEQTQGAGHTTDSHE